MDSMRHTAVVSHTRGRTRLKLSPKRCTRKEMDRIAAALQKKGRVRAVEANLRTGSILVHHERGGIDDVVTTLKDLGVVLANATHFDLGPFAGTRTPLSLAEAVADLNRRLGLATNGLISLRTMIPLGFAALALTQLLRRGLEIQTAPWYLLAYAAFESFVKLHDTRDLPQRR